MKAQDLISPFSWTERRVAICDRVWYVPHYYDQYEQFVFPGWQHEEIFKTQKPIKIEYCSGNGDWIAQKALQEPQANWVAVEMQFVRVRKIWAKLKNHQLDNLLVICGEGYKWTRHYIPANSVNEVFINFPDPWPKRRHAKNRIIQQTFLDELIRILEAQGKFTFVTDDPDYSKLFIKEMKKCKSFISCYPDPYFTHDYVDYGTSYFEELWRHQGKPIFYHQYYKQLH